MASRFIDLPSNEKAEALQVAAGHSGRPANLLEKDIWVVWVLSALYSAPVGEHLSFKGGTSLSKGYKVIDRFSEDIDLTYDIRQMLPDLAGESKDGIPATRAQGKRWADLARAGLPKWIAESIQPTLAEALQRDGLTANLIQENGERLFLEYQSSQDGYGYIAPRVMLEFGARSTGEPVEIIPVTCDASGHVPDLEFPTASPRVMVLGRTFWEKATATHVYCVQEQLKGERFARHWYDLARLEADARYESLVSDTALANMVATHKNMFFRENGPNGQIDYLPAVNGAIRMVPEGAARTALEADYAAMTDAGLFFSETMTFDAVMDAAQRIQDRINKVAKAAA